MSSKNDLKISRQIYQMAIKEYISKKRTLSDKSLDTYTSVVTSLYANMFPEDVEGLTVEKMELLNNPQAVEQFLMTHETKYKKLTQKKVVLSTLAVIFELQIYRDMLLKINKEIRSMVALQTMTPEQSEGWVSSEDMLTLLAKLEKNVNAIYRKKDLTPADLQEIQQYIILCLYCGKYIPPRRSQDYFNFKCKEINEETHNYLNKKDEFVFNSFKGRFVNTKDKEGGNKVLEKEPQKVPIPVELKRIIAKWVKTTNNEYLLFDIQGKQLNASQLNQRMNKMFGKERGCGINQMRHTHLTEKYGHLIEDNKALAEDMTAMGSSVAEAPYYIQQHPLAGANGSHPSHHPTPEVVLVLPPVPPSTPVVTEKKARKPKATKVEIVPPTPVAIVEDELNEEIAFEWTPCVVCKRRVGEHSLNEFSLCGLITPTKPVPEFTVPIIIEDTPVVVPIKVRKSRAKKVVVSDIV